MADQEAAEDQHTDDQDMDPICSAKGCQQPARFDLGWNNPKIHTPDRRKHWMACAQHHDRLTSFLNTRGFLREVEELTDRVD